MRLYALPPGSYLKIRSDSDMTLVVDGREVFIGYCTLTDPKKLDEKLDLIEDTEKENIE